MRTVTLVNKKIIKEKNSIRSFGYNLKKNAPFIIMVAPVVIILFVLCYLPMSGIIIAFKTYKYNLGMFGSPWSGLENFKFFFTGTAPWIRVTKNTLLLNLMFLVVGTSFQVFLALMLFEVKNKVAIKFYQTTMFFPYFLSWVIVGFMSFSFMSADTGVINSFLATIGIKRVLWFSSPQYWPAILLFWNLWKHAGMGMVIYYASLMGIDQEIFEACKIDGASKIQTIFHISVPHLVSIVSLLTILNVGGMIRSDFGLFYYVTQNSVLLYPTTDVIDTYVFRALKELGEPGMGTAVGLYQSMVGLVFVLTSNYIVKRIEPDNSLF